MTNKDKQALSMLFNALYTNLDRFNALIVERDKPRYKELTNKMIDQLMHLSDMSVKKKGLNIDMAKVMQEILDSFDVFIKGFTAHRVLATFKIKSTKTSLMVLSKNKCVLCEGDKMKFLTASKLWDLIQATKDSDRLDMFNDALNFMHDLAKAKE